MESESTIETPQRQGACSPAPCSALWEYEVCVEGEFIALYWWPKEDDEDYHFTGWYQMTPQSLITMADHPSDKLPEEIRDHAAGACETAWLDWISKHN